MLLTISSLQYTSRRGAVLRFPDFSMEAGSALLLLGSSGSGKTTLLHLLAGLKQPSGGQVFLAGTSLTALAGAQLDAFRSRQIGLVFQDPHLLRALTVEENLLAAQTLAGHKPDRKRAGDLLSQLGVGHLKMAYPQQVSRGEAQRIAIARALMNRPPLVLADEPTASLDDANALAAAKLLLEQTSMQGASLLLATHDQRIKPLFGQCLQL